MKESPVAIFKRERDLILYLDNRLKRKEVLILLGILLVLVLIQSTFISLSDILSHPSLACCHQILLLEVDRCEKGAFIVGSSILVLMV